MKKSIQLKYILIILIALIKPQWTIESPEILYYKFWLNTGYHQLELFVAPVKWREKEWKRATQMGLIIATAYAIDQPVKSWTQRTKGNAAIQWMMDLPGNWTYANYYYLYAFGVITDDEKLAKTELMGFESAMLTSTLVFNLKSIFNRRRPIEVELNKQIINDASFPSGHTSGHLH